MRLEMLLVFLLVTLCLAQNDTNAQRSIRTPQGHIQYNNPNGQRVSWKLYSPYAQWRSHLDNSQSLERTEQAETVAQPKLATAQEAAPMEKQQQPQIEQPVQYKPYSMVPTHIKQLIFKMYEPQGPYVDPTVYIYHTPLQSQSEEYTRSDPSQSDQLEQKADRRQESVSQEAENYEQPTQQKLTTYQQAAEQEGTSYQQPLQQRTAASYQYQQSIQNEAPGYQQTNKYLVSGNENSSLKRKVQLAYDKYPVKGGHIEYKSQDSESKPAQYGSVPPQTVAQSELPIETTQYTQHSQENTMPSLLQQLLNLQAQTPYYVIANRITYKPKKMFIPKPISEDGEGPYTYRSKVYYLRDDDVDQEDKSVKHVKEDQRH